MIHYFDILIEPRGKQRPFVTKRLTFTPKKTMDFERNFKMQVRQQLPPGFKKLEGPLKVNFMFNFQRPKAVKRKRMTVKPDIDNVIKICCDSLNDFIWKDDAQICYISASKEYNVHSSITLIIEEIED